MTPMIGSVIASRIFAAVMIAVTTAMPALEMPAYWMR